MNRSFLRKLTTMAAGLFAVVAFSMANVGCSGKKPCGPCDKPCAKKCAAGCTKPCCGKDAKKEEPKKEEPKKP